MTRQAGHDRKLPLFTFLIMLMLPRHHSEISSQSERLLNVSQSEMASAAAQRPQSDA